MADIRLVIEDEQATTDLAARCARAFGAGLMVFLQGDLGAGKTTLVRAWLHALGHAGPVRSPTYTLIEPYPLAQLNVYHLDLYRLGDPEELELLGLRDCLDGSHLVLVEWPERGEGFLGEADVQIELAYGADSASANLREIGFRALSEAGHRAVSRLETDKS